MSVLEELQKWYRSQCNEDWEHTYGIKIDTLDNPGWQFSVDIIDSTIESKEYVEYSYGVGEEAESSEDNWLSTKVENGKFVGVGGPEKLEEIIKTFLTWANSNA